MLATSTNDIGERLILSGQTAFCPLPHRKDFVNTTHALDSCHRHMASRGGFFLETLLFAIRIDACSLNRTLGISLPAIQPVRHLSDTPCRQTRRNHTRKQINTRQKQSKNKAKLNQTKHKSRIHESKQNATRKQKNRKSKTESNLACVASPAVQPKRTKRRRLHTLQEVPNPTILLETLPILLPDPRRNQLALVANILPKHAL